MLYDQDAADLPARAEDIVGAQNGGETTALTAHARQRLADPDNARFLIDHRIETELRRRWSIDDVEERLQRYVVLDYPTEAAAEAAFRRLSRDRNVLSVEFNGRVELSATPNEPWFAWDFSGQSEFEYQWGIFDTPNYDTLNLAGAWDITRGTAYVGLPDTGIQINHPDLQQAFRPQFAKNVVSSSVGETYVDEVLFHPKTYIDPVTSHTIVYAGHGTHVAGIIAANTQDISDTASGNNPAAYGGAGVCWRCSLIVARVNEGTGANSAAGLVYATESGAQVINMSWGWSQAYCPPYPNFGAACDALLLADQRQVVLVGASGNESDAVNVQYPARDARVIPVAGLEIDHPYPPKLWRYSDQAFPLNPNDPINNNFGSSVGGSMTQRGLLAPARDVFSTVYAGYDWNAGSRCGDSQTFNWPSTTLNLPGSSAPAGYGVCTGTSMAAPHVTGIVALMRTVDPMQPSTTVRSRLLASGNNTTPNSIEGYGIPDATAATTAMLNGNPYRLTPLFALSGCGGTRFYTVVPQMAMAAINGTLPVRTLAGCKIYPNVTSEGSTVPSPGSGNYYYPGGNPTYHTARAQAWVFSTHNPRNEASRELKPLYRLSRRTKYEPQVNHFYSTDFTEAQSFINTKHYKLDGIEGYVYPADKPPPTGAVRLKRASKDAGNAVSFAVFPEALQSAMQAQGYICGVTTLGWAFPNNGSQPTY